MPPTSNRPGIPASLLPEHINQSGGLESDDLSFRQAIRIVRKRKSTVFWIALGIGLLTLIVSVVLRPYYSSTASIEIQKEQNDLGGGSLGALASSLTGEDDIKTEIQTEVSILQSDDLLIETIERTHFEDHEKTSWHLFESKERDPNERGLPLNQAPKAREKLLKDFNAHLTVSPVQDTRLIQVIFEDPDAHFAADTANALIDQYVKDRLGRRNSSTVQASEWMTGEINDLKGQVQTAEQKLIDYQRQSGLIVLPSVGAGGGSGAQAGAAAPSVTSPVLDRLTQLNTNLVAAEANRITLEAIYRLAKAGDVDALTSMASGMQGASSGSSSQTAGMFDGLLALRLQQTNLKLQLTSAMQTFGPKNPHLIDLDKQLEALDERIHEELERILNTTEMNYEVAKQAEDGIRKAYTDEEHEAYKMNDSEIRLAVLQQEADSTRALYEDLYTKLQESKLSEGTQSSNIAVISRGLPAHKPMHPKVGLNAAIGLLAGLVIGIVATFALDALDDTVTTTAEVEKLTGLPVLAAIPLFNTTAAPMAGKSTYGRKSKEADLSPGAKSDSQASEAYRALRTTILLSQPGSPPRTLLMASALPSEGKTTTCYGLGACFAILGTRVLVIDADLRRPTLHNKAGVQNSDGLSNLLTSNSAPNDAIVSDPKVENLFILPSGPVPPNPAELLGSKVFDRLLETLAKEFDLVLIDSPPTMIVADGLVISAKVDRVIVVLRSGATSRSALVRVVESFRRNKANLLGLVLNRVDTRSTEYYYDQGYYGKEYPSEDRL